MLCKKSNKAVAGSAAERTASYGRMNSPRSGTHRAVAGAIERDGRPGYRLSGELCIGRLLPTDVLRAVESAITSNKVVAPTGFDPVYESRSRFAQRCMKLHAV